MSFASVSILIGFLILVWRLGPALVTTPTRRTPRQALDYSTDIKVSLIVPCRNEEKNLPALLRTLAEETWPHLEIVLVDDGSTDTTLELLRDFARTRPHVKVVRGAAKPAGWAGKNWACHQGAQNASGDILLFTDADTRHRPSGIARMVAAMQRESLDVISVVPSHLTPTWWEKGMGLFYLFTFVAGRAFQTPTASRFYAIGQYLAFRRSWYERVNHASISDFLSEDMELVQRTLEQGGSYRLLAPGLIPIYQVRMYSNFREFLSGWRRIFRLGFGYSNPLSFIEVYFLIALFALNFRFSPPFLIWVIWLAAISLSYRASKRWGDFPIWAVALWPLALAVFIWLSLASLFDQLTHRQFQWRDRAYSAAQAKPE